MSKNRSSKKNINVKRIPQNALYIGHSQSPMQTAFRRKHFALGIKTQECKARSAECKNCTGWKNIFLLEPISPGVN